MLVRRWSFVALALVSTSAYAQSRTGERRPMERDAEIALARSAAPSSVSGGARVWLWDGARYVVGDSGSAAGSGVQCYVGRPWVPSVEPHCFDAEGARTILPIQMRRVELYAKGRSEREVEADIAAGIKRGALRLPRRPAVTYMMSQAQDLVNGEGSAVGAWQPHLMIYWPRLTSADAGLPGFVAEVGFVENPGTPFAAMVIPLKSFVPATHAARH